MTEPFAHLQGELDRLKQKSLYRSRRVITESRGINVVIDGKLVINFCSNDYLGLSGHPTITKAFQNAANEFGAGSGSAHLVCGHSRIHHELEQELADFTGRDRALLFSTGYMANLGVITALLGRHDTVFEDRLNHASLLDGGLASNAVFRRYQHANVHDLARLLSETGGHKLIVTDGVFSMDGDFAPLDQLAILAKQDQAWLMVDDAHGLGVVGRQGKGILDHYQLDQQDVPILMGTLGKAFGSFGAFVAGPEVLIETLIQKARTYIYTTALPSPVAAASLASLQVIKTESWRRDKLNSLITRFRLGAQQLGLALMPSSSPIQPVLAGDSRLALAMSTGLLQAGFLVSAIRPPTVPSARLRITLSALHDERHVDQLLDALSGANY